MTKYLMICVLVCLGFARCAIWECETFAAEDTAQRPNILFIFVDDQGYYDLGCYGATEVDTPRIDSIAAAGVRFTDYYAAAPICSPSRAGLMTGCYPRRVGMETWVQRADSQRGLHPDELTIAELLKANGYATACIGKWHLGFAPEFLPQAQGFDHYFGLLHNLDPVEVVYFDEAGGVPLMRNGEVVKRPAVPAELTKAYTDEAIAFIEQHRDGPFFLYLPHTMLHVPLGVSPEFQGTSRWGEYGDATQELDFHVGRLLDALEKLGIADDTLVIYASDNGRGPGRDATQPLRGNKLTTYETGLRVPCMVKGPGVRRAHVSSEVVSALDWYPTIATFAGVKVPAERVIDGRDLSPLLAGATDSVPPSEDNASLNGDVPLRRTWEPPGEWAPLFSREEYVDAFFYHGSEGQLAAVRSGKWKLWLNPSLQLFDLEADPGETRPARDLAAQRKLRGMAVMFQEEMSRDGRRAGFATPTVSAPESPARDSRKSPPPGVEAHLDLVYARYGERELELDLYRPKDAVAPRPGIVCIHGGGWFQGDRESHGALARALAAQGFVAATITYRLSGEAPFPAQIHDCKAAVRWLRANAAQYGVDPDRIGAIGLSAGGHLAALLATSGGVAELEGLGGNATYSSTVQAVVAMGAQTDLESERNREISADEERGTIWRQFLGGTQEEQPNSYRLASPLHHLDAHDPPVAFISGENDDASTHADAFRAAMKQLGLATHLKVIHGAPHAFLGRAEWFDETVRFAAAFFTIHLDETP